MEKGFSPSPELGQARGLVPHSVNERKQEREYIWQEATDLLKRAQETIGSIEVGTTEATFAPKPEYPNLPIAMLMATDIHYGSVGVDYDLLNEHLDAVENTPNMYLLGNGDDVDNFSAAKFPDGQMEDPLPPTLQSLAVKERLLKLGAAGKIAGLSFGNHNDFMQKAGYNWLEVFARDINAPIFTAGGFLHVLHGEEHYGIALTHMYWGKSKLNPTNAAKRFWEHEFPQADVAFLGHTHQSEMLESERGGKDRIFLIGGTYKQTDKWAKRQGYGFHPGQPGNVVMFFPGEHKLSGFKQFDVAHQYLLGQIFQQEAASRGVVFEAPKSQSTI